VTVATQMALFCSSLSKIKFEQKRWTEAESFCRKSLHVFEQLSSQELLIEGTIRLGQITIAQDNPSEANKIFEKVLKFLPTEEGQIFLLQFFSSCNYQRRYFDFAEKYLIRAIEIFKRNPKLAPWSYSECVNQLAAIYRDQGNETQADQAFNDLPNIISRQTEPLPLTHSYFFKTVSSIIKGNEESLFEVKLLVQKKTVLEVGSTILTSFEFPSENGIIQVESTIQNNQEWPLVIQSPKLPSPAVKKMYIGKMDIKNPDGKKIGSHHVLCSYPETESNEEKEVTQLIETTQPMDGGASKIGHQLD